LYKGPTTGQRVLHEHDVPFYARQQRILFGNNGKIDPKDIRDYIKVGGYSALARVLTNFSPQQVVDSVKRAGLRGRGGAGFPTGTKWEARSEEHTSELQSRENLVCRLLLEKKKQFHTQRPASHHPQTTDQ